MGRQAFTFIESTVKAIGFYTSDLFTDFLVPTPLMHLNTKKYHEKTSHNRSS